MLQPRSLQVARLVGPLMFLLSLVFLMILAAVLTLVARSTYDRVSRVERVSPVQETAMRWGKEDEVHFQLQSSLLPFLLFLWVVFPLELILLWFLRDRRRVFWADHTGNLIACLCPPLRMGIKSRCLDNQIWLPLLGWREVDDQLRETVERAFSVPMIVIALTILPLLLVEWRWIDQVHSATWLTWIFYTGTGLIWLAFAVEFIVMVSLNQKKFRYCKEHWIDLAIILLPLVSFLRSLRVLRVSRLAKFAKIQQLAKMGRVYRLRALALRTYRALLLLELFDRVLWITPEKRLRKLREQLAEKEREIQKLRDTISVLEAQLAKQVDSPP